MLELNSTNWVKLSHAYGEASDIPPLLQQLEANPYVPHDDWEAEPWFSLWSTLCHQGDVYTASYGSLPHLVRIAASITDATPDWQFFALPASIESRRLLNSGPPIPTELAEAYFEALLQLHDVVHNLSHRPWDDLLSRAVAAALVVSKGHARLAETILDLSPEAIKDIYAQHGKQYDSDE
jgi:hypothetical protein